MKSSRLSENTKMLEQQPYYPPKGSEIGVYCTSCHSPHSIMREQFYNFTCTQCRNRVFNVGYFCRNCNKIYPLYRYDFINLKEAEILLCNECNNEMDLLKS